VKRAGERPPAKALLRQAHVLDPLSEHCLCRRANPLVGAVFRTNWLPHERYAATCLRRRRPGQARRRQGKLQITSDLRDDGTCELADANRADLTLWGPGVRPDPDVFPAQPGELSGPGPIRGPGCSPSCRGWARSRRWLFSPRSAMSAGSARRASWRPGPGLPRPCAAAPGGPLLTEFLTGAP